MTRVEIVSADIREQSFKLDALNQADPSPDGRKPRAIGKLEGSPDLTKRRSQN